MAKKPKWIQESTVQELLEIVGEGLDTSKEGKKAKKALAEVIERLPDTDGELTVEEALEGLLASAELVKEAYSQEVSKVEAEEPDEEDEDEDEDEDREDLSSLTKKELITLAAEATGKTKKSLKKMDKEDLIELIEDNEDDDEDEDDEDIDYTEMSTKELKEEMKRRGLKVKAKMKKSAMIEALEEDDED